MHNNGLAHSVECYLNKELVGGLYGIEIGRIFLGKVCLVLSQMHLK